MKKIFIFSFLIFTQITISVCGELGTNGQFFPGSVAVTDNALAGFYNPANVGYRTESQFMTIFPTRDGKYTNEFGAFFLAGNGIFGGELIQGDSTSFNPNAKFHQRWHISQGAPIYRWLNLGMTFRWYGTIDRKMEYDIGLSGRPYPWISFGTVLENSFEKNGLPRIGHSGIAFRPIGDRFTVAADIFMNLTDNDSKLNQKYYCDLEPLKGFHLMASYQPEQEDIRVGVNINFSSMGLGMALLDGKNHQTPEGSFIYHSSGNNYRSFFQKPGKTVMALTLEGVIDEEPNLISTQNLTSVKEICDKLKIYEENPGVKAVLLKFGLLQCGFTKRFEIRQAILNFRNSGKKVYCYVESLTNGDYFLASACDKIYLNPAGTVWLTGLSASSIYFKGVMNKLGIKPEWEYIGKFKSAHESYTREEMSEPAKEQLNVILDDMYEVFIDEISKSRNISPENLDSIINNGLFTSVKAKETGLIDELIYQDQLQKKLEKELNGKVTIRKPKRFGNSTPFKTAWQYEEQSTDKIALIYATGGIMPGKSKRTFSGNQTMGSTTISKAIQNARKDKTVKAIVLRIDSPGGSALASDIIWREVILAKKKKPVIVSMSDVAASGGYYIACAADKIIANPTTLTGSIGVLGGKFDISGLMDKIGINVDVLKRGESADMMTLFRPWTTDERKKLNNYIHWIYDDFTKHVAEGRGMSQAEVKEIAQGRIWSGKGAKEVGLVDEIGGLEKAIEIAIKESGIKSKNVHLKIMPKWWSGFLNLEISTFYSNKSEIEKIMPSEYQLAKMYFNTWLMNKDEKVQLLMPYWIIIE